MKAIRFIGISIIGAFFGSVAAGADATRTARFDTPGAAEVVISWAADPSAESAMVVREAVPEGWTAAFKPGAAPDVAAFRDDGASVAFLVPREALVRGGELTYALRADGETPAPAVFAGTCVVATAAGGRETPVAGGVVTGPGKEEGGVEGVPVFRGFRVASGEHPRVTFVWEGSGTRRVAVQWRPALALGGDAGRREAENGWTTFATFEPPAAAGSRAASAAAPFEYSPDADAPAGFYRLAVETEEVP